MNMWNKGLAWILAAVLLLSGCATGNQPAEDAGVKTTTTSLDPTIGPTTDPSSVGGATTSTTQAAGTSGDKTNATADKTPADNKPADNKPADNKPADNKPAGNSQTTSTSGTTRTTRITDNFPWPTGQIKVAGPDNSVFAGTGDSIWDKRIAEELEAVEKELNITFKVSKYDSASLTAECIKAHQSGAKFCDILVTTLWQQRPLVKAGVLTDLNTVSELDLTKSCWDQPARKSMTLYNKNFIGFTTLDGTAANANVLFFNKTLAKRSFDKLGEKVATPEAAAQKLYAMVEDGRWTFDQIQMLSRVAQADLTGDGKMDDRTAKDQYGFSGVDMRNNVGYAVFKSKGGYFTKKSTDGGATYALSDATNTVALRTVQTWMLKDTSIFNPDIYGTNPELGADAFQSGRVLFLGWTANKAPEFASMRDDWGILPYPKASTDAAYTTTVDWDVQGFSIPAKVKGNDLTRAATVMDRIAERFQAIRQEQDKYMLQRVYRDTKVEKMVQLAASTVSVDVVQFGDLGSGGLATIQYLFDSVGNDPKQRVDTVRDSSIKALNDFLKAVK